MRVIIVGCGRVGARVAAELDQRGENITVIDTTARAFARLPQTFKGETVRVRVCKRDGCGQEIDG